MVTVGDEVDGELPLVAIPSAHRVAAGPGVVFCVDCFQFIRVERGRVGRSGGDKLSVDVLIRIGGGNELV